MKKVYIGYNSRVRGGGDWGGDVSSQELDSWEEAGFDIVYGDIEEDVEYGVEYRDVYVVKGV